MPDEVTDALATLPAMLAAAWEAGRRIRAVYATDFAVRTKADATPVTKADRDAEATIISYLLSRYPDIPCISEETPLPPFSERRRYDTYWLIDPLDGTREFVKRNGEFTVNIALMAENRPALGVVYAPVTGHIYCGGAGGGTWRFGDEKGEARPECDVGPASGPAETVWRRRLEETPRLPLRTAEGAAASNAPRRLTAAVSRSHESRAAERVFEMLRSPGAGEPTAGGGSGDGLSVQRVARGSSLKFGMVADGSADFYLRYGRTMEWDTAAGEAVARGAGCRVLRVDDFLPLAYNKEDLANPAFVVCSPGAEPDLRRAITASR